MSKARIDAIKREIEEIALSNAIGVYIEGDRERVEALEKELEDLEENNG